MENRDKQNADVSKAVQAQQPQAERSQQSETSQSQQSGSFQSQQTVQADDGSERKSDALAGQPGSELIEDDSDFAKDGQGATE